jgi:DNA-dependent protein kinase catalytic subunit
LNDFSVDIVPLEFHDDYVADGMNQDELNT